MYCGKCGRLMPGSATVCSHCGTSVEVIPPSAKPFMAGNPAPERPVQQPQQPRNQAPQQPQYQAPQQPQYQAPQQSQYQAPQQPQYQQPQQNSQASAASQVTEKPAKKKPNLIVAIVVIAAAMVIGRIVGGLMADSYKSTENQPAATQPSGSFWDQSTTPTESAQTDSQPSGSFWDQSTTPTESTQTDSNAIAETAYAKIFMDNGAVLVIDYFDGKPCKHFAINELEKYGTLQNIQFAFENDVITELVSTIYIYVDPEEADMRPMLMENLRGNNADLEALSFVEIAYDHPVPSPNFITVQITYHDLDRPENVQKAGILDSGALSADNMTRELIRNGFIQLSTDVY